MSRLTRRRFIQGAAAMGATFLRTSLALGALALPIAASAESPSSPMSRC